MWIVITMLWTWIRYSHSHLTTTSLESIDRAAALEFLKERANFYRSVTFGLVAASLALLVGSVVSLHSTAKEIVTNPRELFMLDQLNNTAIANYSLLLFFGPILESLRAWERIVNLFLGLKSTAKRGE
jgi:hypothetical protein